MVSSHLKVTMKTTSKTERVNDFMSGFCFCALGFALLDLVDVADVEFVGAMIVVQNEETSHRVGSICVSHDIVRPWL